MLDHEAIRKAYPDVVSINDATGAFDKDDKPVTLEQSKIDADSDLKVKFSAFYNSIKAVKDANPKP